MADAPFLPAAATPVERRPAVGYAMVATAAVMFAVNGSVSKVMLDAGLSSMRLTQVRSLGAALGFAAILLATRPGALRIGRRELGFLAIFGVAGVAAVQLFYFLAIERLDVGVALLIQYIAPLLVALWARFAQHEHLRRRIWAALALALGGLSLVVDLWRGVSLDGLGVGFALLGAVFYMVYLLLAEKAIGKRDPVSLLCYGFFFASVFWAIVQPWWNFPWHFPATVISLSGRLASLHLPMGVLMIWQIVFGTIIPFVLIVGSLRHLRSTRVAIMAMVEPVVATLVAWLWLKESLGAQQLVGGAIVLAGIALAQTAR